MNIQTCPKLYHAIRSSIYVSSEISQASKERFPTSHVEITIWRAVYLAMCVEARRVADR